MDCVQLDFVAGSYVVGAKDRPSSLKIPRLNHKENSWMESNIWSGFIVEQQKLILHDKN